MPRLARVDVGNEIYHVINRAVGRTQIYKAPSDYQMFLDCMKEVKALTDMRILAYIIMPNHWHLVLWPQEDKDLSKFMHLLTNRHTRNVHVRTKTIGHGPLYQGRYKSFIVDSDNYLKTLIKYVEQNPVRANLVNKCQDWRWGSAYVRTKGTNEQKKLLNEGPVPLPQPYVTWINSVEKEDQIKTIRYSINKGVPYGRETWVDMMIDKYNLETTKRGVGRPKIIP
jgi:putative transposase